MNIKWSAVLWSLGGLALIFLSLALEMGLFAPSPTSPTEKSYFGALILQLLVRTSEITGIACLVFGLLHIMVETVGWSDYFRERLQQIVMEQSYLNTLDKDRLTALQTSVLKAEFRNQQIDREGSFYNYLRSNLHRYIASPYREDVSAELIFTDAGDRWAIFDRVTYICRKAASSIQADVQWGIDPGEYASVDSFKVEIQFPYTHNEAGKKVVLYDSAALGQPLPHSLTLPLADYKEVDGLIIIVSEEYVVLKDRFQYWTMTHPTKNFDITLKFPTGYKVQSKPMVLSPDLVLTTVADGYYKAKYDFWMLPQSGMAWKIYQETQAASTPAVLEEAAVT